MIRFLLPLLLLVAQPAFAQDKPEPLREGDILPYLEQVISFSQAVSGSEQMADNAREVILKNTLKQNTRKIVQKGFDFANAQAAMFGDKPAAEAAPEDASASRHARLMKAIADNDNNITDMKKRLTSRGLNAATRERLGGELKLAYAQQDLLNTMAGIFSSDDKDSSTLSDQIKALARTELEFLQEQPPVAPKEITVKTEPKDKDEAQDTDGMLKLSTSMFSYARKQAQVEKLIEQNKALTVRNREIATSIRAELRAAIEAGKALSAQNGNDAKSMGAYRESLNGLMVRYRQLGATIVPIGEMNVALESSLRSLQEWKKLVGEDWARIMRQLLLRLTILSIAVAIPLVISSIAHRATQRYISDPKRKKLLNIIRRILLGVVLAFVILANFITEFGSLATFAGFITAGLAVALQTVLVSLVAHFFFFGRYGIRAGDRVTISGVTGDVIQVGVLRLYIREMEQQEDGAWVPSGKMVAFPNSILFQPAAFYKHVSATE